MEFLRLSKLEPPPDKLKKCEKCSFTSKHRNQMNSHKRLYHRSKELKEKYTCHECGFEAPNNIFLTDHINVVHLNKKVHKCDKCDYSCGYYNNMVIHKKIHQPDHIGRNEILEDH